MNPLIVKIPQKDGVRVLFSMRVENNLNQDLDLMSNLLNK